MSELDKSYTMIDILQQENTQLKSDLKSSNKEINMLKELNECFRSSMVSAHDYTKQLESDLQAFRERLKEIEWVHSFLWVSDKSYHYCPACNGHCEDGIDNVSKGHKEGCWLSTELDKLKGVE